MHPNSSRRVHGAEFKSKILVECQKPGVSVASVALAHGLNVNLVRKWLVGRGLKRCGLVTQASSPDAATLPALQFMPLALDAPSATATATATTPSAQNIHIELRRGEARLSVQWPASQPEACAAWLRELATSLR
jgi:transposase